MAGLLTYLTQAAEGSKRKLRGLLNDPVGTLDAWADRNVQAYTRPDVQQMAGDYMGAGVIPGGMLGHIVYHGSPHKFTKFDMSKIGTGEGAQAYGHGLYFAESPDVAKWYGERLPDLAAKKVFIDGVETKFPQYEKGLIEYLDKPNFPKDELYGAFETSIDDARRFGREQDANSLNEILASLKKAKEINVDHGGAFYKVDIPDESIPRMLDWDKPLSEQPEAANALSKILEKRNPNVARYMRESVGLDEAGKRALRQRLNVNVFDALDNVGAAYQATGDGPVVVAELKRMGIPGIRYLDGMSRNAGQGSFNYVLFDDQLPRILEVNGQPTGLAPWKPGEFGLLGGR